MAIRWNNLPSLARLSVNGAVQLLYPNLCWACSTIMPSEQKFLCAVCTNLLTTDPFPTCPRCSSTVGPHLNLQDGCPSCRNESFAFDGAFRMAPYEGPLREVILRMKHGNAEELAEVMATVWSKRMAPTLAALQPDLVVPVLLHWWRRWRRGFNQSDVLARQMAKEMGLAHASHVLRRQRATPMQTVQGSASARWSNVKAAFQLKAEHQVCGKTVILVDDVMTTGATASEAARALRRARPKAIYVAVLAHGQ